MFHFGKNNGGSVDELLVVWVICLITTRRKLIVIMFRILWVLFQLESFVVIDCPKFGKNRLFDERRQNKFG